MPAAYDPSDFVDSEYEAARTGGTARPPSSMPTRAPTREEVDAKSTDLQVKIAECKRTQEELERERAALEELRRRQIEYQTGREEMVHSLTRGVGLLEEAEFAARRDAEQMARTLADFRDALEKVQALNEQAWPPDSYNTELTRALTTIENARMEWNGARLKFPVLSGQSHSDTGNADEAKLVPSLSQQNIGQLCKFGLALTWPLVLLGLAIFLILLLRG